MKRGLIIFFRAVIVLTGIGVLAFMLWEPHLEGRNVHATLFEMYFKDAFLAYAYVASIPFFVALYQAFKALGYAGQNIEFRPMVLKSLRIIKYCAIAMIGFVAVGEIILILGPSDDRAGGIFIGFLIVFASSLTAAAAARY